MLHVICLAATLESPSAEEFYTQAVAQMNRIVQPSSAAYSVTFDAQGANVSVKPNADGAAVVNISTDGAGTPHAQFEAVYHQETPGVAITTTQGEHATASSPAFVPFWSGIYAWLRFGLHGAPVTAASASPDPQATGAPPVIAVVASFGTGNYRAEDAGEAPCPNGDAGHRVHLTARNDSTHHPLTDATIDIKTGAFCTLRFTVPLTVSGFGASARGIAELELGESNGYSVVEREHFVASFRRFGIHVGDVTLDIGFTNFQFSH